MTSRITNSSSRLPQMLRPLLLVHCCAALLFVGFNFSAHAAEILPVFNKGLPSLPENQEVVMISLEYEPGESTPPHKHNAHTYVYVLEGAVDMQVEGAEEVTVKAGGTFYEYPHDIHVVSRNSSSTETAKLLVFFIKTIGAPTTIMINE